ncbi:hypothetical protein DPM19_33260 [Actinomadura craniellae]|uniref:Uncharacterized protein n=1 Tax=Actinomadura craniellae TaxID=2231787 RepID=A0A365GVN8_9ACTN|nr:SseB family protein [Actinomadura craniellae]RAY10835.1 hypothetical protein DPM19_33260 [Actinomadura craniellae]
MDWQELAKRLTRELMRLPDNSFLIVQGVGGFPYVQAMRYANALDAEAVSNTFLPEPMTQRQEQRLEGLGWHAPDGRNRENWWRQVPLPVDPEDFTAEHSRECAHLAGQMVSALHEVYRVRSLTELVYEANQNGPDGGSLSLPDLGLRPVDESLLAEHPPEPEPLRQESAAGAVPAEPAPPVAPRPRSQPAATVPPQPQRRPAAAVPPQPQPQPAVAVPPQPRPQPAAAVPPQPRPAATVPPRPQPQPVPNPVPAAPPAETVEKLLMEAKERGDQHGYFRVLLDNDLYVPLPTGASDGTTRYATATFNDGTYVLAFTSPEAMERSLRGQATHFRQTTFPELARSWPRPEWELAVNAGLPSAAYIDAGTIERLARSGSGGRRQATTRPGSGPAPAPQPPPAPATTIMQKPVPPAQVPHYLEGGYDRVAGYVHRVQDVAELTNPERLVRELGLTYEGSPFSILDEAIHVIRWPAVKRALFKTPYGGVDEASMRAIPEGWVIEKPPFPGTGYAPGDGAPIPEFKIDSQRLPHGAEMYQITRFGERFVAAYDADVQAWVRPGEKR